MEPFGEYVSRAGNTTIEISPDQTVRVFFPNSEQAKLVFEGKFSNFDEIKGTEFHVFENPIFVKSGNTEQADLILHIAGDCSLMKGGSWSIDDKVKIKIDDNLFWNINREDQK